VGATRQRLTTTQRGLGHSHQRARKQALAALRDGDPCARCETLGRYHPMYRGYPELLELDDFPPRSVARALGIEPVKKLSWKRCNRSHGGRLGNRIKALRRAQMAPRPSLYNRW